MLKNKKKLGKGLSALISSNVNIKNINSVKEENVGDENLVDKIVEVAIDDIIVNPYQPRHEFDSDKIDELAESIKENGLLQPIALRKKDGKYEIVFGERRFRALKKLEYKNVRAIIKTINDNEMLQQALIENIQRSNLNPIDEALAIKRLMEEFNLTHEEVSTRLGKQRSSVSNLLRLLKLPDEIQEGLVDFRISTGHAKVLLSLDDSSKQIYLYELIIQNDLSIKETINQIKKLSKIKNKQKLNGKETYYKDYENLLTKKLNKKVKIKERKKSNLLEIEFKTKEELEEIMYFLTNKR